MEVLLILAVFGIPGLAGCIVARRCSRHRLAIVALIVGIGVVFFASSVPYAAFASTLIGGISAGLGYILGRFTVRPYKTHREV
jgi:hypothetical protein